MCTRSKPNRWAIWRVVVENTINVPCKWKLLGKKWGAMALKQSQKLERIAAASLLTTLTRRWGCEPPESCKPRAPRMLSPLRLPAVMRLVWGRVCCCFKGDPRRPPPCSSRMRGAEAGELVSWSWPWLVRENPSFNFQECYVVKCNYLKNCIL